MAKGPLKKIGCVLLVGGMASCGGSVDGRDGDNAVGITGLPSDGGAVHYGGGSTGVVYLPGGATPGGATLGGNGPQPGTGGGFGGGYVGAPGLPDAGDGFGGAGLEGAGGEASWAGESGLAGEGGSKPDGPVGVAPLGGAGDLGG
jgi:hypothetical protein